MKDEKLTPEAIDVILRRLNEDKDSLDKELLMTLQGLLSALIHNVKKEKV